MAYSLSEFSPSKTISLIPNCFSLYPVPVPNLARSSRTFAPLIWSSIL